MWLSTLSSVLRMNEIRHTMYIRVYQLSDLQQYSHVSYWPCLAVYFIVLILFVVSLLLCGMLLWLSASHRVERPGAEQWYPGPGP